MLTKSLTLTEQVARQIAADIAGGAYPVGAKLPAGRVLAEQYGVSAAVIREATERLRAQGLIQSRQGSGSTVLSRTGAQGFQLSAGIAVDRKQLAGVYELRMELEGGAAALAAQRRNGATTRTWLPWRAPWRTWSRTWKIRSGAWNTTSPFTAPLPPLPTTAATKTCCST